jgi:hypothetical protein
MDKFLLPNEHKPESATESVSRHYPALQGLLRWLMILTFLVSTLWSSMYLISRFIDDVVDGRVGGAIVLGFLCIIMLYNLWVTFFFTVVVFIGQAIPDSRCKVKVKENMERFNNWMAHGISTHVFGIDRNDTEHGEISPLVRHDDDALVARLERIEKTLEKALALKDIGDRDPDDSCVVVPPLPL